MGVCAENRSLIKKNKNLNDEINDIQNENKELKEKLDEINNIQKENKELKEKVEEINDIQNENKELREKIEEINNIKNDLEKDKINIEEQYNTLKTENDLLKDAKFDLMNIKNDIERDKIQLESEYQTLRTEYDSLKGDKYTLQKKNEDLIKANKNKNQKNKDLENKYNNLYKEMDEIKRKNEENENYRKFLELEKDTFISNISKGANNVVYRNIEKKINIILNNQENDLKEEIIDLIKKYNFADKINEEKKKAIKDSISEFNKKSKHLNIILLGKTGIGKSELINALKGEDVAETGGFRPVTKETKYYEANSLRIFDNQGYEISKNSNLDIILERIKELINKSKNNEDPDWFIHCIWYCITGSRFEEDEEKAIGKLLEMYEDKSLPIIIVYLKATCKKWVNDMKKGINNTFNKNICFMPVLSKDVEDFNGNITKKFGLKDLVKQTGAKVMNAINSISFEYVLNNVKRKIRLKIEKINNNTLFNNRKDLEDSIKSYLERIIGNLDIITINSIKKTIQNIKVICNNINFNEEIDDLMKDFKKRIDKKKINYNDITKYDYYINNENKVKSKIMKIYEKYYNEYKDNNLIEKIYNFYIILIKNALDIIVTNNLKSIKKDVISKMQKAIENNPNFERIFVH